MKGNSEKNRNRRHDSDDDDDEELLINVGYLLNTVLNPAKVYLNICILCTDYG